MENSTRIEYENYGHDQQLIENSQVENYLWKIIRKLWNIIRYFI